jgi:MFS family permease
MIAAQVHQRAGLSDRLVLVIGLAVLLNYVDRGNLATAAPLLQQELALTSSQMGVLLSAFFWVYAPAQLLAGWLAHRFDIRIVLASGVALWAVATTVTGLAGGFATLLGLRLLLGLGESVTFPCWLLILARNSVEHQRARANGLVSSGQGFGPMLGTLFGGLAMAHFGWRAMFIGLGAITFLWLWPWLAVTRGSTLHGPHETGGREVSYVEILGQRGFWGAALGQFLINYAFYFVLTWLPSFLVKAGGFTVSKMAGIGAAIYGIYAVATVLAGTASDRWIRRGGSATHVRKTFLLTAAFGSAVTIACCALVTPQAAVWLLGITSVFFGLSTPMIFAVGATLAGPRAAGRWAGAQNLAGQVAGIVSPLVTGFLVQRTGGYSMAFAVAAAAVLLSTLAWGIIIRQVAPVQWADEAAPYLEPVVNASR